MLEYDDIERIMEAASVFDVALSEKEAQDLWKRHCAAVGSEEGLPLSYSELLSIVEEYLICEVK